MDEKDNKKKEENKVNDPGVSYGEGKNRIVFFNSFEEEAEYNAKEAAEKNPIQGIKDTVGLILRVYGFTQESLRDRKSSNEIIVDKE
jgi:hypothetical protein